MASPEASFARLQAPLAAALVALPWMNPLANGPSPSVQPWLLSAACGLLLWLLAAVGATRTRLRPPWVVLAVVAWAVLSQGTLRPDVAYLAAGLLLIAISASLGPDESIGQGAQAGLLLAAVLSALLGLAQYFGVADWFAGWVSHAEAGEAFANLRQPNQYSTLVWIGAAVLLWGTIGVRQPVALLLVVLLAVGSAASVSRTGMLQGLVLTLLAAGWNGPGRRRRLVLCAVAAVAYFAAAAVLPLLLEAATGAQPARTRWGRLGGGEGCSSRLVLWSNVLHLIASKPLAGWGWGDLDYAHFMTLYPGGRFCDILDNAHDLPLHLAVELGVPAAVLLCAGMLAWTWRRRPWREQAPLRRLAWALLALIALHSLLEYPLWYGQFQLAAGLAIGWLAPAAGQRVPDQLHRPSLAVAALLLAATGYAGWDYERVSQIYLPPEQRRPTWRDDALQQARRSWLFDGQARFAELTLASVTRENAPGMHALALDMLHYSPEPRVVERVIESATLLGREDEAVAYLARFRAAFPREYQEWHEAQGVAADGGRPPARR